jgi:FKBP-type peptidyl-prolyl cis-trans isomerase FklB
MRNMITAMLLIAGLLSTTNYSQAQEMDSLSYALGVLMANNLNSQGFEELDKTSLITAFRAVLDGEETQISQEQANQIVTQHMRAKQEAEFAEKKQEGQAFLDKNAERPEVKVLPSGLQYEVLQEGEGEKPTADSKVKVHYHGTLIDGTVFDSSVERGEPATFGVGQVIEGWTEALQLMPEGAKWKLYIPSDLAYGARGAGQKIGPYTTLIFEVELLEIM